MWYGVVGMALTVAALVGQREAWLILFLWVAWPIVRGLLLAIPRVFNNSRKKEEKEDIGIIEAEMLNVKWEDNSQRSALPRTTRPELPDPDVVEAEWKELPPPSTRWRQVLATGLFILGSLLFLAGAISFVLTLLR